MGVLFVVQMLTAMVGTTLIEAFVDGDSDAAPMRIGVLLMPCSGLAVVGIGLLMYPVLKPVDARLALWYPILRITECVVSAACGIYLLTSLEVVPNHLLWVVHPHRARRPGPHLPALRLPAGPAPRGPPRSRSGTPASLSASPWTSSASST